MRITRIHTFLRSSQSQGIQEKIRLKKAQPEYSTIIGVRIGDREFDFNDLIPQEVLRDFFLKAGLSIQEKIRDDVEKLEE